MNYLTDRKWSDIFMPEVKRIIGFHLLIETSEFVDTKEAADLVMFVDPKKKGEVRIAVRVRSPGFLEKYPGEFTLRCDRDTGTKTELEKILEGHGDMMFYGHATEAKDGNIKAFYIIDLNVFRKHFKPTVKKPNGDGTWFMPFKFEDFPDELVIAKGNIEIENEV